MPKYVDVEATAYDYGTLTDWLISSVGPEPPVWTEQHIEELMKDFYVVPKGAPSADVQPVVSAYWEPVSCYEMFGGDPEAWYGQGDPIACHLCSNCKGYPPLDDYGNEIFTKYCPDCGAKMKNGGHD